MFRKLLVILDYLKQISTRTVLSYFPHVVFGFHEVVELDDILMSVDLCQYFGLIVDFRLACFFQSLDGYELKFLFLSCLENDRVFSFGLFFVDVIIVHC
jgi:hypothetical protein